MICGTKFSTLCCSILLGPSSRITWAFELFKRWGGAKDRDIAKAEAILKETSEILSKMAFAQWSMSHDDVVLRNCKRLMLLQEARPEEYCELLELLKESDSNAWTRCMETYEALFIAEPRLELEIEDSFGDATNFKGIVDTLKKSTGSSNIHTFISTFIRRLPRP